MNNIRNAFDNIATKYDAQRRKFIPCFDDFYGLSVAALNLDQESPEVLDIGAGTGIVSSFVLKRFPHAQITLIDLSEGMLEIAKTRLKSFSNLNYINGDYLEYHFDGKFDIIISALSIHHLTDEQKIDLYTKCFNLLEPGGIFVNADQVCSSSSYLEPLYKSRWRQSIEQSGISQEEILAGCERMKLDREATLESQLSWLSKAGFSDVECLYKYYNFAVMFGMRKLTGSEPDGQQG